MKNFDVQVIFDENGKTFDSLICDIVNTFFIRNYINAFRENETCYEDTTYNSR